MTVILGLNLAASAVWAIEANKSAPQGGVFNYHFDAEPESLHPIMKNDLYTRYYDRYTEDTLCENDFNTWGFYPRLAEKWEISKDGLQFTFFLRKDAVFHNDVKIYFFCKII